ncbi:MAG: hypothetical protein C0608_01285 [Deltaproteobacteria bacterium]|nr:MAG: hypothetical protein C0608_01285 [Deltaproteobacteria bacterium]
MRRTSLFIWAMLLTALLTLGCSVSQDDSEVAGTDPDPYHTDSDALQTFALYEPGLLPVVRMPMPNDVTWMSDDNPNPGSVYLPLAGDESPTDMDMGTLKTVVNGLLLPGLSPNMFLSLPFSAPVDISTLEFLAFRALPDNTDPTTFDFDVRYYNGTFPEAFNSFVADDSDPTNITLIATPPLIPGSKYIFVVKSGLEDMAGEPVEPSFGMRAIKSEESLALENFSHPYENFEPIRLGYEPIFDQLLPLVSMNAMASVYQTDPDPSMSWLRDDVLLLWTATSADITLSNSLDLENPASPGNFLPYPGDEYGDTFSYESGEIGIGGYLTATNFGQIAEYGDYTIEAPYSGSNIGNAYSGFISGSVDITGGMSPVDTIIPFLATLPEAGSEPYPVVLFQHGLGSEKESALAIANRLAANGIATVAIDAPFHGERAVEAVPESGIYIPFFTANILLDRANVYQGAFDLSFMTYMIETMDLNMNELDDFNMDELYFGAHSLGAILGSTLLNGNPLPSKVVLTGLSSNLANVLDKTDITSLGTMVESLGYTKGTPEYYVFLNLAQWLMDPVDGAYMGVGQTFVEETVLPRALTTLAIISESDPTVPESSGRAFLKDEGMNLGVVSAADPLNTALPLPGGFLYAVDEFDDPIPMSHSFEYNPVVPDELPLYITAQNQIANFFSPMPVQN